MRGEDHLFLRYLLAILGYSLSTIWFCVNRGSKYWQENWEKQIEYLTQLHQTPIFGLIKVPEHPFYRFNKSYSYSVSRLNQLVSLLIGLAWLVIIMSMMNDVLGEFSCFCCVIYTSGVLSGAIGVFALVHFFGKSSTAKEYSKNFNGVFLNY